MPSFSAHFGQHVMPKLAALAASLAPLVALGILAWGEAMARLTRLAWDRGAACLPDATWFDLLDWLATRLAKAVEAADLVVEQQTAKLIAIEASDPVRYYDRLAADDPRLAWAFASISPPYREALNQRAREGGSHGG
jgi:hypothetical protein